MATPERDVTAIYGELLIPLVGEQNQRRFMNRLDLSLAGRFEDFSDFGDTFNPKIGAFWVVGQNLAFRASYSKSFRAPVLNNLFFPAQAVTLPAPPQFFTGLSPAPDTNDAGQVIYLYTAGGNPRLEEETADVWSAGFELTPSMIDGFSLTGTYFNIAYENRIETINPFEIIQVADFAELIQSPADTTAVANVFSRAESGEIILFNLANADADDVNVLGAAGNQNLASRDVDGIDLTANYELDTDAGRIGTFLNATYLFSFDTQLTELSDTVDQLDVLYRPVDFRLRSGLSWTLEQYRAFLAVNHTGSYQNLGSSAEIDAWTTFDLTLSYTTDASSSEGFLPGIQLSFNIRNLFDEAPPFVETIDGLNFDTSNADPFGRQISISLRKTF